MKVWLSVTALSPVLDSAMTLSAQRGNPSPERFSSAPGRVADNGVRTPMRPFPDDYAEARRLLAPVFEGIAAGRVTGGGYLHDHDEELGCYWFGDPAPSPHADNQEAAGLTKKPVIGQTQRSTPPAAPRRSSGQPPRPPRARDQAYWDETGRLVMDYFELQAGALYSETLEGGFIAWLQRSPAEQRQYEEGDDMTRAALVDWFLRLVR